MYVIYYMCKQNLLYNLYCLQSEKYISDFIKTEYKDNFFLF